MTTNRRQTILNAAADLAGAFLRYDRKEDEDLPRGEIGAAIAAGEVTEADIVARFADALREELSR